MHLVILGVDIAWNANVETFTEGGGFVSKHLGNPLLSTGRSDSLISYVFTSYPRFKNLAPQENVASGA